MREASIASVAVPGGFHDGDWVESKDQDPDGEIRLLQLADVGDGLFRDRSDRRINEAVFERLNCSPVWAGDVLIARMPDPLGRACIVPSGLGRTVTVVDVAVLRCDEVKADQRYVTYAINANPTRSRMESLQDGATRQRISRKRLGRVQIPLPTLDEQRAIADYLDRETACIDTLIKEQRRLIEMLHERRRTVLVEATCRGISSSETLKPSGVGWIGDVPTHWKIVAIKWLTPVKRGASPRPIDDPIYFDNDGEWAWVRIADVSSAGAGGVLHSTSQTLSELGSSLSVKIEPGQLFVSIAATVGKPCIAGIKCCIHDGFVYFPDLRVDPWWLFRIFEAGECYRGLGKLGTQLNLNTDSIGGIKVPVPPPDEIRQILAHLKEQTEKVDTLIAEAERFIEISMERRAALITAAVTGQIDVRETA